MGFFSWITSDTQRSIPNTYQEVRPTFTVHMITWDGQVFTESEYEGYGVFGGKDFYVLAAELNGFKGANDDETRDLFFDKIWKCGVRKGDKVFYYRNDFNRYESKIQVEGIGEVTPNQLVAEHGWESWSVSHSGDTQDFVDAGFKMPKIVEVLGCPAGSDGWQKYWDSLPYPESCPDQGYIYCDDCDDREQCLRCGGETDSTGVCWDCEEEMEQMDDDDQ